MTPSRNRVHLRVGGGAWTVPYRIQALCFKISHETVKHVVSVH
jgi:hypothetical protein